MGVKFHGEGWLANTIAQLLGGRPMQRDYYVHTETATGRDIYHWTDRFGRPWLAAGAWSWLRKPESNDGGAP